jgi:hypothetical protein
MIDIGAKVKCVSVPPPPAKVDIKVKANYIVIDSDILPDGEQAICVKACSSGVIVGFWRASYFTVV